MNKLISYKIINVIQSELLMLLCSLLGRSLFIPCGALPSVVLEQCFFFVHMQLVAQPRVLMWGM